ncbi:MAG: SDR family oxidoreductase [bacterium]|nr:SDR family oxidoreductase [bacterium]
MGKFWLMGWRWLRFGAINASIDLMNFQGKNILVLGGIGSVGGSIADAFEGAGGRVAKHGFNSGDFPADLADSSAVNRMVEKVLAEFGRVDILVNAVSAPVKIGGLEKKSWADFSRHLEVQLKGLVEVASGVLPKMKEQKWGRIINILSSYTLGVPPSSLSDYVAAKYAMLGLTKALAKELGRFQITVNGISPSFIKNNFTKEVPERLADLLVAETPLGRLAVPADVTGAVLFLASESAGFITGVNLPVSGGSSMG